MYHVSDMYTTVFKELKPNIPRYLKHAVCLQEETDTPRLCVAPSIFQAIYGMGRIYGIFTEEGRAESYLFHFGKIDADTGQLGIPLRIYECAATIDVPNQELIRRKLVPDAQETGEAWYTRPIKWSTQFLYFLTDMTEDGALHGYIISENSVTPRLLVPELYEGIVLHHPAASLAERVQCYYQKYGFI